VEQQQSIDNVVNTPAEPKAIRQHLRALSNLNTPKTEPKPTPSEMHPKTVHPTTNAPNSGFKLGFADLPPNPPTVATAQNTPSRSQQSTVKSPGAASFQFTFGSEAHLSSEAQKLMENVREEAARIKAQMQLEKENQDEKDAEAELMFEGINATGRKIAKPKPKAGRFSDVHMAEFKKMDSIANHASSFRAKPGYIRPTTQSLKRSGSKAELDEPERPRTAGKGTPSRIPPPFGVRPLASSPFKSIPATATSDRLENTSPAKRQRRSEAEDVSAARPRDEQASKPSAIPKSVSTSLLSPTKASLARSNASSPAKVSMIPRSQSAKSIRNSTHKARPSSAGVSKFTSKLIEAQQEARMKPLPPTPAQTKPSAAPEAMNVFKAASPQATTPKQKTLSSRLPTFSGLKSILRSTRKPSATKPSERVGTPKRPNTANAAIAESAKKVDFTPSVKSRYAVKLAASSPAPAKLPSSEDRSSRVSSAVAYDPAAYVLEDDDDEAWEDESSPVSYPTLPPAPPPHSGPVVHTFSQKAKDHNRRESKEFKSIFTTLHPNRPSPLAVTSTNPPTNQNTPAVQPNKVTKSPSNHSTAPSASTIRRVRQSGVTEIIQPFEDASVRTMPHGLPSKKRRRASASDEEPAKTTQSAARRSSKMPSVPGGWEDSVLDQENIDPGYESEVEIDEGAKRGAKRARHGSLRSSQNEDKTVRRFTDDIDKPKSPSIRFADVDSSTTARSRASTASSAAKTTGKVDVVKGLTEKSAVEGRRKSVARQQAARNAKERKAGVLSLSRLNVLSRPKQR
jgi:hypothetical protein